MVFWGQLTSLNSFADAHELVKLGKQG